MRFSTSSNPNCRDQYKYALRFCLMSAQIVSIYEYDIIRNITCHTRLLYDNTALLIDIVNETWSSIISYSSLKKHALTYRFIVLSYKDRVHAYFIAE